jgi:hypothetical protein
MSLKDVLSNFCAGTRYAGTDIGISEFSHSHYIDVDWIG